MYYIIKPSQPLSEVNTITVVIITILPMKKLRQKDKWWGQVMHLVARKAQSKPKSV